MNESQKPLNMMLQGAIFTVVGIILIFITIISQATIPAFLVSLALGVIFCIFGLALLRQGYHLTKKLSGGEG
ncbi:MAG: hypothetical protein DRJ18_00170 [Candidatus Methanomethylicota archaeon]|nr:MAG: hypothetical protein DRJ18_00170 [Candidatus Verstraetearchaeota archaeon]